MRRQASTFVLMGANAVPDVEQSCQSSPIFLTPLTASHRVLAASHTCSQLKLTSAKKPAPKSIPSSTAPLPRSLTRSALKSGPRACGCGGVGVVRSGGGGGVM